MRRADQALAYAAAGWPVHPTRPDASPCPYAAGKCQCKAPVTQHGVLDATTDPDVIRSWWRERPDANVAIATGAPGPDVLDVDTRPAGNGFAALNRIKHAGLLTGASALVRTPSGGLHLYYAGTEQAGGKLGRHFIDFKATGGYVVAPPSRVHGKPYELIQSRPAAGCLDWQAVCQLLDPRPVHVRQGGKREVSSDRFAGVVRHLSALKDGDQRWRQLHWAACRAAEAIAAEQISEPEAREALLEACRANGYIADHGEREAHRKIDRGLRDGAA
jgi:hypothetical protein